MAATDPRGEVTIRVYYKSYDKSSLTEEIDERICGSSPDTSGACHARVSSASGSNSGTSIHTMLTGILSREKVLF